MKITVHEAAQDLPGHLEQILQDVDALEYSFNGEFLAYVYAERDYEDYLPKHYNVVVVNAKGKEIRRDQYYTMLTAAEQYQRAANSLP